MSTLLCETRSYSHTSHTHYHSYSQLILPLKGNLIIKTKDHELSLDKNHLFFMPPNSSHSYYSERRNEFLVLDIPKKMSPFLYSNNQAIERYETLNDKWLHLKYLLYEEVKGNNKIALKPLFNYAIELLGEQKTPTSIQYIHDNFQEHLPVKLLADIENYNLSHYIEWFYKQTGTTPNHYIQKHRINRAKKYLLETDLSILNISQLVGYDHQASLTRLFKKHENITPNQYRKLYRNIDKNTLI